MAKNRSQASAFNLMADFSASPAPSLPGGQVPSSVVNDTPPPVCVAESKAVAKKPRPQPKKVVHAPAQKARRGSTPCERTLRACNVMLYVDQLRPLALLEIDTNENRSELVRRLIDTELKKMGYDDFQGGKTDV